MSTESFVQGAPDSTGKAIDAMVVTPPGATVNNYRQVVTLGDDAFAANTQEVGSEGDALVRSYTIEDLLLQVLVEMRVMNTILQSTLGGRDDLDALRQYEATVTQNNSQ